MSNQQPSREEVANAFGRTTDPLESEQAAFEELGIDPFDWFRENWLDPRNPSDNTRNNYEGAIKLWRGYMDSRGRHPACPSEEHAKGFIRYLRDERGNAKSTITNRIRSLNTIYRYWVNDDALPHGSDYNPIEQARDTVQLDDDPEKDEYRIPVSELRDALSDVKHVRDLGIIGTQFKLGTRAGETANIQLRDLHIANDDLLDHYSEMGTSPGLKGHENAIFIPESREGNKSDNDRILPLDKELRGLLTRYLLVRPDNGESNLFLSDTRHEKMTNAGINEIWTKHLRDKYPETNEYNPIRSHYGRHRFTTYWRVERDAPEELVNYMRGDSTGSDGMSHYIHTYYQNIEELYRKDIYQLRL